MIVGGVSSRFACSANKAKLISAMPIPAGMRKAGRRADTLKIGTLDDAMIARPANVQWIHSASAIAARNGIRTARIGSATQ